MFSSHELRASPRTEKGGAHTTVTARGSSTWLEAHDPRPHPVESLDYTLGQVPYSLPPLKRNREIVASSGTAENSTVRRQTSAIVATLFLTDYVERTNEVEGRVVDARESFKTEVASDVQLGRQVVAAYQQRYVASKLSAMFNAWSFTLR